MFVFNPLAMVQSQAEIYIFCGLKNQRTGKSGNCPPPWATKSECELRSGVAPAGLPAMFTFLDVSKLGLNHNRFIRRSSSISNISNIICLMSLLDCKQIKRRESFNISVLLFMKQCYKLFTA